MLNTTVRRFSLVYKILGAFILLGILPGLAIVIHLVTLTNRLFAAQPSAAAVTSPDVVYSLVNSALTIDLLIYLAYAAISIGLIALLSWRSLIRPIQRLEQIVSSLSERNLLPSSNLQNEADIATSSSAGWSVSAAIHLLAAPELHKGDEVESLAVSLSRLAESLLQIQHSLEEQVLERNRALQHQATQFHAAASVGQAAASLRDINELLTRATELICENFGYYHVGIFLIDDTHENAVLRAANSEGGKQMLARGHKLALSGTSIVGHVANTRQPRIALNVGADAVHFRNPYLPETRSEVALPLSTGDHLWGILDVQSTQEAAFSEHDITTLQIMANQLGIAIENANLFVENQAAVAELRGALETSRKVSGEITQEAWRDLLKTRSIIGYTCTQPDTLTPVSAARSEPAPRSEGAAGYSESAMIEAGRRGEKLHTDDNTLIIPIRIRQQVAGVVRLCKPSQAAKWAPAEIDLMQALSDQLGVALESARLYEETRRRAERERLTSEITARLRSSDDPQLILQTAIQELRRALQASRAQVLLYSPEKELTEDRRQKTEDNHE